MKPWVALAALAALSFGAAAEPEAGKAQGWAGDAGLGPVLYPKYQGGRDYTALPLPLLSINYQETFYVELQRAGVYVLASDDKKIGLGLALEPRFGYSPKDGPRLAGMARRKLGAEGGLTFDWDFDVVAVSLAYFDDLNGASRGTSQRVSLYKPFVKANGWEVGGLIGADRLSARVADYYFGVDATEATAQRPAYRPDAGTHLQIGAGGTYHFDKRRGLMFGFNTTRLGRSTANSPIVESRRATMVYLGYAWVL